MASIDEDMPQELEECFEKFSSSLDTVEDVMKPLLSTPRNKFLQDMTPLEVAKLDLVSVYSVNALFWAYLITQGVNPRTHPVKKELDRIKTYMAKVKEIEDKGKAPKLEKDAAKRMMRNAMFDLEEKNQERKEGGKTQEQEEAEESKTPDVEKQVNTDVGEEDSNISKSKRRRTKQSDKKSRKKSKRK